MSSVKEFPPCLMTLTIRRGDICKRRGVNESYCLSYFKPTDEVHLDFFLEFGNRALKYFPHALIIIADWEICKNFYNRKNLVESELYVFLLLLYICDAVKLNLQLCLFIHESLYFFLAEGFNIIDSYTPHLCY